MVSVAAEVEGAVSVLGLSVGALFAHVIVGQPDGHGHGHGRLGHLFITGDHVLLDRNRIRVGGDELKHVPGHVAVPDVRLAVDDGAAPALAGAEALPGPQPVGVFLPHDGEAGAADGLDLDRLASRRPEVRRSALYQMMSKVPSSSSSRLPRAVQTQL